MTGRDAQLLRAPSILPEGQNFVFRRSVLGVVEASHVAEAQEDVVKAVLGCESAMCKIRSVCEVGLTMV